jgi:DNA-binding transcriptional ArsR family regulator
MAYGESLAALADPTRRSVFERLAGGPRSVGEIAAELPVSRPAVSQHLRVLKEAGLVAERRNGTRRYYRVRPDGLAELRGYVERFWEEALSSFKAAAERGENDESAGN